MTLPESNGKIVLISGINGYIASRTALRFLEAGYSIRGTSRRAESARPLIEEALKEYNDVGRISIVEVPDITVEGAFDEAVKGVHAIAHMASPVSLSFTDPDPVLHAAITGTLTILNSASKHAGSQLKHFVLISSVAAIYHPPPTPTYTFTEKDWNDFSPAEVRRLGKASPGNQIYNASKSEAERALWKWVADNKPSWTAATVNPAFVYGPPAQLPKSADRLNETIVPIWKLFSGEVKEPIGLPGSGGYVDVRDVADLMVFCVAHGDEANGQRYLAVGGVGPAQATVDALRAAFPERRDVIPEGTPGVGYSKDYSFPEGGLKFDSSKGRKAIGHEWIRYDKTVVDTAKVFERFL
jgi:nucleoside-diphosphate-sugar epimerase